MHDVDATGQFRMNCRIAAGYAEWLRARLVAFTSSVHVASPAVKARSMKKAEPEMRAAYKRSDFANLERGKFFKEASKGTSLALIDPNLAKTFPSSEAVNEALRGLLALADETARITGRSKRTARKRATVFARSIPTVTMAMISPLGQVDEKFDLSIVALMCRKQQP